MKKKKRNRNSSGPPANKHGAPRPRTRLPPAERSRQIVQGAIAFFAEHGFGGRTRDLAAQLGITQGLLYRYFPNKEMLIERIYEEMFVKPLKPEWEVELADRTTPLLERLRAFYLEYATVLHDRQWGRIYLYCGLGGATIARRFVGQITQGLFPRVIGELRHELGLPDLQALPMTEPEQELIWGLHGSIFYIGIRASVYRVPPPRDVAGTLTRMVENFYDNAHKLMREERAKPHAPARRRA
jgi:AcrR family transcriptional regulator